MSIEASPRVPSAEEVRDLVHGPQAHEGEDLAAPQHAEAADQSPKTARVEYSSNVVMWRPNWVGAAAVAEALPSHLVYNSTLNVVSPRGQGVSTTSTDPQQYRGPSYAESYDTEHPQHL